MRSKNLRLKSHIFEVCIRLCRRRVKKATRQRVESQRAGSGYDIAFGSSSLDNATIISHGCYSPYSGPLKDDLVLLMLLMKEGKVPLMGGRGA
jgi:hypothetical protein